MFIGGKNNGVMATVHSILPRKESYNATPMTSAAVVEGERTMKHKRRYGTALWIGLILLLSVFSVILFAEVDSDMPMYEEGVVNEKA